MKATQEQNTVIVTTTAISFEIKSDLLSKIPPHKLSQIVEATLCQLQKAYAASSWNSIDPATSTDSRCTHAAQSKQPHSLEANQEKLRKFLEDCKHFEIVLPPERELHLYRKFLFGIEDQNQSCRTAPSSNYKAMQRLRHSQGLYDQM